MSAPKFAVRYAGRMGNRYKTAPFRTWCVLLATTFACVPALAEDVAFEGRTLEVEAGQDDTRTIVRIVGPRYQLNAAAAQIVEKTRACLAGQGGVSIEAGDAGSDRIVANSRVNYRAGWGTRSARSRIDIEASEGYFRIIQSGLGVAETGAADASDADYGALQQAGGWDDAVSAMITLEQGVIDCLYR